MASSFASVTFYPVRDAAFEGRPSREYYYSERHIPYSDSNVLDMGGNGAGHYAHTILVAAANVVAFDALRGTTNTLVVEGETYTNSTLVRLTNRQELTSGEYFTYDAEWITP